MTRSAKHIALYLILASAMPLASCSGGSTNELPYPTAPTVNTAPPSTPSPIPPVVTPPPVDRSLVTITGRVQYLRRSGANDLDVTFRTDDFTIVSATSTTPVHSGSLIGQTDFLREGQTVITEGRRDGEFLYATKITIIGF
jgi:hypothetical protein